MATCPTCGAEMHPEHQHFHGSGYTATNFPPDVWPDPKAPWIWDRTPAVPSLADRTDTDRDDDFAAFFEPFVGPVEYGGEAFVADVRDPDWRDTEWRPLRWERPRIVSTPTDATAAGTPRPNGWEA